MVGVRSVPPAGPVVGRSNLSRERGNASQKSYCVLDEFRLPSALGVRDHRTDRLLEILLGAEAKDQHEKSVPSLSKNLYKSKLISANPLRFGMNSPIWTIYSGRSCLI